MKHTDNRPQRLTSLPELENYYWLKSELIRFCSQHDLPTSGSKELLTERIRGYFNGDRVSVVTRSQRMQHRDSDKTITDTTPVKHYKNDAATRHYFMSRIGPHFKFNSYLRQFSKPEQITLGLTYGDLVVGYLEHEQQKQQHQQAIPKQFEYNQFIRDYFQQCREASLTDAIAAWNAVKAQPGPNTYDFYRKLCED